MAIFGCASDLRELDGAAPRKKRLPTVPPYEVPAILRGLHNASVKKLVMVQDGENPTGDPCEAFHWHGFIGMEQEAVDIITQWIARPVE